MPGKKCRGSTGFLLVTLAGTTLPATKETFGANIKQSTKMHQNSGKTTLRYHAFQTARQWVRGELEKRAGGGTDK